MHKVNLKNLYIDIPIYARVIEEQKLPTTENSQRTSTT
jgi:hypothetical protein